MLKKRTLTVYNYYLNSSILVIIIILIDILFNNYIPDKL